MGDTFVGLQARLMSQALRKLAGTIAKTNCVVIFINQLRMKIGVMYGNPETTTGGNALKFYSSVRLDVRRVESIKDGGDVVGNKTRVKVVKNKVAPPFREAYFDIMYGEGISKWGELVDLAVQMDIVQKSGSWFSMGEERIGQGKDSVKAFLQANPEIAEQVEEQVREKLIAGAGSRTPAKAAERPPYRPQYGCHPATAGPPPAAWGCRREIRRCCGGRKRRTPAYGYGCRGGWCGW